MAGRTYQLPQELQSYSTQLNGKGPGNSLLQSATPNEVTRGAHRCARPGKDPRNGPECQRKDEAVR